MKKLVFVLCLVSATSFADKTDSTRLFTCKGMEVYGMSSIEVFDVNETLSARIGMYPSKNFTFGAVTQDQKDKYFLRTEAGQFFLIKTWMNAWVLSPAYVEPATYIEVECQD